MVEKDEELRKVPKMLAQMAGKMLRTAEFQGSVADYAEMLTELAVLIEAMHDKIDILEKKLAEAKQANGAHIDTWWQPGERRSGWGYLYNGSVHT
jgi:hypothetical protein